MTTREIALPSLQEIEQMDKLRQQAIESLQISESDQTVRCQQCDADIPIVGGLVRSHGSRITHLQDRIKRIENHPKFGNDKTILNNNVRPMREELAQLLVEDAKADKLRRLPLYSSRLTNFKFVCGSCFEKQYSKK